ncbi:MAG: GDSL-type esterase/lipase family protein [Nakamurella sp.]
MKRNDDLDSDGSGADDPRNDRAPGELVGARRRPRRLVRWGAMALLVLVLGVATIAVSLWITPMQQVSTAGQTVAVGVTAPQWSVYGPGEVDLFGQRLPTVVNFPGPVRPRLELRHISLGDQLAQFATSGGTETTRGLQAALTTGWVHFFIWQLSVAAAIAVLIFGAVAGWLRHGVGQTIGLIAIGLVVTVVLDAAMVLTTASSVPSQLAHVRSLQDLVGATRLPELPSEITRGDGAVRKVAVIGDSTAAGLGNPILADPSPDDAVCGRSSDAFAAVLASANDWDVTNLACARATIRTGLLDSQPSRSRTLPPQITQPAVSDADLIIVSIGANDVSWSSLLQLCAVSENCANSAEQAYFQQQLASFSTDLLQLVAQLQQLPKHPAVIINQYYDPFPDDVSCLADHGMTPEKQRVLHSDLAALNSLLSASANAAGFTTAAPEFSGHGVCATYPYVQDLKDPAPFHPNAAGQLAIALADQHSAHAPRE